MMGVGKMGLFRPNVDKLRKKGDIRGLVKAQMHEEYEVKKDAAGALGEIGDASAVKALIAMLKAKEIMVRRSAAKGPAALYREGDLDAKAKKAIVSKREIIEKPHTDYDTACGHHGHADETGTGVKL